MKAKKKQEACDLFIHAKMNRTQIAGQLGVDRRTIGKWIAEGDWERLKRSAQHLPTLMAEHCYHIFGLHASNLLAERNRYKAITLKDVEVLYRLACTIAKLGKRATLNESMEMMTFFSEHLRAKDKDLSAAVEPHIDDYLQQRAGVYHSDFYAPHQTGPNGTIPDPTEEEEMIAKQESDADWQEMQDAMPSYTLYEDGYVERVDPIYKEEDDEEEEDDDQEATYAERQEIFERLTRQEEPQRPTPPISAPTPSATAPTAAPQSSATGQTPPKKQKQNMVKAAHLKERIARQTRTKRA